MDDTPPPASPPPKFLLLLTSYQSSLYAAIAAMLGGVEGAHDVLQETNLVLLQRAAEYDVDRPFLPWALAFARFQVLAWRKRQSRDRLVLDDDLIATVADRLSSEAAPSAALDALERCLNKLSADAQPGGRSLQQRRTGDRHRRPAGTVGQCRLGGAVPYS